jgi:hypothetical protein
VLPHRRCLVQKSSPPSRVEVAAPFCGDATGDAAVVLLLDRGSVNTVIFICRRHLCIGGRASAATGWTRLGHRRAAARDHRCHSLAEEHRTMPPGSFVRLDLN